MICQQIPCNSSPFRLQFYPDGDINIKKRHDQEIKVRIPQGLDAGLKHFTNKIGISKAGLIRLLLSASLNVEIALLKKIDELKDWLGPSQTIRIDSQLYKDINEKAGKVGCSVSVYILKVFTMFREVNRGKLIREISNTIAQSLKEGMKEKKKQEEFDKLSFEEKNKIYEEKAKHLGISVEEFLEQEIDKIIEDF